MPQPTSSASRIFNACLGLAHNKSVLDNLDDIITLEFFIIKLGLTPVSAILPAKTDIILNVSLFKTFDVSSTCFSVSMAVIFNWIPSWDSFFIKGIKLNPLEFVMGILTLTFFPHVAIFIAWISIPLGSSAKTSKLIGKSGMNSKTSLANFS